MEGGLADGEPDRTLVLKEGRKIFLKIKMNLHFLCQRASLNL
ncbi:OSBPL8 isoform 14, partial [Pongo abelii]